MFLELKHTNLDVFKLSQEFTISCYRETKNFPPEEKYAMVQQIRRAALSVYLNLSEGFSRSSLAERRRYCEIARGSLIEVDSALDIAVNLNYTTKESLTNLGVLIVRCFQMLSKMIVN